MPLMEFLKIHNQDTIISFSIRPMIEKYGESYHPTLRKQRMENEEELEDNESWQKASSWHLWHNCLLRDPEGTKSIHKS